MASYRINARLPGGMGMPAYEGSAVVDGASDEDDAIAKAKTRIRRVHGDRPIVISKVERIRHDPETGITESVDMGAAVPELNCRAMRPREDWHGHELSELIAVLQAQDSKGVVSPMYCLQIRVRDHAIAPPYGDGTVWINMASGDFEEVEPGTAGALEFGYRDRWQTVMVAFTERGLHAYMEKNGHNVRARAYKGETRIHVESFCGCDEMVMIRKLLLALPRPE